MNGNTVLHEGESGLVCIKKPCKKDATFVDSVVGKQRYKSLWTQWGLFFICLSDESEIFTYKSMNSEGMKSG